MLCGEQFIHKCDIDAVWRTVYPQVWYRCYVANSLSTSKSIYGRKVTSLWQDVLITYCQAKAFLILLLIVTWICSVGMSDHGGFFFFFLSETDRYYCRTRIREDEQCIALWYCRYVDATENLIQSFVHDDQFAGSDKQRICKISKKKSFFNYQ